MKTVIEREEIANEEEVFSLEQMLESEGVFMITKASLSDCRFISLNSAGGLVPSDVAIHINLETGNSAIVGKKYWDVFDDSELKFIKANERINMSFSNN